MKGDDWRVFFHSDRFAALRVLILCALAALAACRIGAFVPVAAQERTKANPNDGLTYVWVPPGTFQMGCSPNDSECQGFEKPTHSVTITSGFWIGQTPVTQAAYQKVVGANPSNFRGDLLPVEEVSWDDARAYCQGVEMRLPTEAEYEYAARGGNPAARYGPIASIAWYSANSGETTHEVGQKEANGYGLYDMLGNVWEWVEDWSGAYDGNAAVDPQGPLIPPNGTLRVLRGGSWDLVASVVRVSYRGWIGPRARGSNIGFRCAGNSVATEAQLSRPNGLESFER